MKNTFVRPIIEPLEQRIAPALLVYGANLLGGDNPSTGEASIGENTYTLVKVMSGQAIVWWDGLHITGISVGPNVSLDITGDVGPVHNSTNAIGSIVANLDANGHLTDSDHNPANGDDGLLILPNNILGITTHPLSDQAGGIDKIITGGSVSNLNISGELHGIYAGDGLFQTGSKVLTSSVNVHMTINPIDPAAGSSWTFTSDANSYAAGSIQSGASITNVHVQTARGLQIFAGNGYSGGAGGSVIGVTMEDSRTSPDSTATYDIRAGNGASTTGVGGAGGSISKIIDRVTTTGNVNIVAGNGGDGGTGAGGAGGSVSLLDLQCSVANYTVKGGVGGKGAPGGVGGDVTFSNFAGNTPGTGIVVSAPLTHFVSSNSALPEDDILMVDSSSGKMVVLKNGGNGTSFSAVVQDDLGDIFPDNDVVTIAPKGDGSPTDAKAADMNGDGYMDILVSYADGTVGVYLNTPAHPGVFTKQLFADGSYTGSQPTGSSFVVKDFPITHLVTGSFGGAGYPDIALLSTAKTKSVLSIVTTLPGNDTTPATYTTTVTQTLPAGASVLEAESLASGRADQVVVGFSNGNINTYQATGALVPVGSVSLGSPVTGLDSDPQAHRLLALTNAGNLSVFSYTDTGALVPMVGPDLSTQSGKARVAHFINDPTTVEDGIVVLSSVNTGSRVDDYSVSGGLFTLAGSVTSSVGLKNFVVSYEAAGVHGVAALPGSLAHFEYSFADGPFADFSSHLPGGKTVTIFAGTGGDGVDPVGLGTIAAKGGNGGKINAVNAEADQILLYAGDGGNSATGPSGAGGSVMNPPTMTTLTGTILAPKISAVQKIHIEAGSGGSPSGTNAKPLATGGAGGSVTGMTIEITNPNSNADVTGLAEIFAGNGGNGQGAAGGNGGSVLNLNSHFSDGNLVVTAGAGGSASAPALAGKTGPKGGLGGSISGLNHVLDLPTDESDLPIPFEKAYSVTLTAGDGGDSAKGMAGAGGSITTSSLVLDAPSQTYDSVKKHGGDYIHDAHIDSTLSVLFQAGNGGDGTVGGVGGAITSVKSRTYFDQLDLDYGGVIINPVVLRMKSGDGGMGSTGVGGNGGAINLGAKNSLLGVSDWDPDASWDKISSHAPLSIESGRGGDGATKGGNGGAISAVYSANALYKDSSAILGMQLSYAEVVSGDGGSGGTSDGGAGGAISGLSIGAGSVWVQSGAGGAGGTWDGFAPLAKTAKGGAGGTISSSLLGSVLAGVNLYTGNGGWGVTGGGSGGLMTGIQFNGAQQSFDTHLVAGDGGDAVGTNAKAGSGGSIVGITQTKDINSAINLLQAGNGGANTNGFGGNGGSVSQVNEKGFIGQPGYGAMDPDGNPQGLFVGRGGAGKNSASSGFAGSVFNIRARQISAIAAAMDPMTKLFDFATSISGVTADLIGYDAPGGTANTYDDINHQANTSPTTVKPSDGFLLAKSFSNIVTFNNARTANYENPGSLGS